MADVVNVPNQPLSERDCVDCGARLAMKLLNVTNVQHSNANVPLRYVCSTCGAMLTVPPLV